MQSSRTRWRRIFIYFFLSKTPFSSRDSYAILARLIVLTRQEPTDSAVPPMELMKASSLLVSDNKRQQLDKTPTLSLTKKFESAFCRNFHYELTIFCCNICSVSLSTYMPIVGVLSFAEIVDTGCVVLIIWPQGIVVPISTISFRPILNVNYHTMSNPEFFPNFAQR